MSSSSSSQTAPVPPDGGPDVRVDVRIQMRVDVHIHVDDNSEYPADEPSCEQTQQSGRGMEWVEKQTDTGANS